MPDRCSSPNGRKRSRQQDGDSGEDGIEEIKGPDRADAYEVEERPFHAQIGEWLVQTLENPICAVLWCALSAIGPSSGDHG